MTGLPFYGSFYLSLDNAAPALAQPMATLPTATFPLSTPGFQLAVSCPTSSPTHHCHMRGM